MQRLFRKSSSKRDRQSEPIINTYDDDEPAAATPLADDQQDGRAASSAPAPASSAPDGRQRNVAPPRSRTYRGPANPNATDIVGWLCGVGREDWETVLRLCDDVSTSQDLAKEATRALRKELEHGQPEPQQRAARLLVIMSRNGGDRFRLQLAQKRFLETVEKTLKSPKTVPEVRNMLFKALSVLAFEHQRDRDLAPVVALYNKVKRPEDPVNGNEIDAEDPVFTPQEIPHRSRRRQPDQPRVDLWTEAQVAKSAAAMLSEALSFTKPEDLDNNELVQEFYAKCQESQAHMIDAIPWATAQANEAAARKPPTESLPEGQPAASTQEEELLAALLSANQELIDVFRMHDNMSRERRQVQEEREVQQRSIVETRFDRNAALQPPQANPFAGGSSEHLPDGSHGGSSAYSHADLEDSRTQAFPSYSSGGATARYGRSTPASVSSPPLPSRSASPPSSLPRTNPYAASQQPAVPLNPFTRTPLSASTGSAGSTISAPIAYATNGQRNHSPEPYALEETDHFSSSNPYRSPPRSASGTSYPLSSASTNPYASPPRGVRTSMGSVSSTGTGTNPYLSRLGGPGSSTPAREGSMTDEEPSTPLEPSEKALGKLRRFSMRDDDAGGDADAERQQAQLEDALRQRYADNAATKRAGAQPTPTRARSSDDVGPY